MDRKRQPYADLSGWTPEQKATRKREQKNQWRKNNPERERHRARVRQSHSDLERGYK